MIYIEIDGKNGPETVPLYGLRPADNSLCAGFNAAGEIAARTVLEVGNLESGVAGTTREVELPISYNDLKQIVAVAAKIGRIPNLLRGNEPYWSYQTTEPKPSSGIQSYTSGPMPD